MLSAVPTLSTLSVFQLVGVALQMTVQNFGIKEVIFSQHVDDDQGLFVVKEKSVELRCDFFADGLDIEAKLPGQVRKDLYFALVLHCWLTLHGYRHSVWMVL